MKLLILLLLVGCIERITDIPPSMGMGGQCYYRVLAPVSIDCMEWSGPNLVRCKMSDNTDMTVYNATNVIKICGE